MQTTAHITFILHWLIPILIIGIVAFALHYCINYIYNHVYKNKATTDNKWHKSLIKSFKTPSKALVWIIASVFTLELIALHFNIQEHLSTFSPLKSLIFTGIIVWFFLSFIKHLERNYSRPPLLNQKNYDITTVRAICQISRIIVILIGLLVYLQTQNINISALLAFGGGGALIVGFGAKDLISNFFGGLLIYFDRPFSVGDWIQSPDREIEGYVEHIGWRLTRIRSFSKRPIYVPNGVFSTILISNPSRMTNRRIRTRIGIRYEDAKKMADIVQDIEKMLIDHPDIDNTKFLTVRFDEFGPSSLNIFLYCFTHTTKWGDYLLVQQDVYLQVIAIIENHNACCALPTNTIHLSQEIPTPS